MSLFHLIFKNKSAVFNIFLILSLYTLSLSFFACGGGEGPGAPEPTPAGEPAPAEEAAAVNTPLSGTISSIPENIVAPKVVILDENENVLGEADIKADGAYEVNVPVVSRGEEEVHLIVSVISKDAASEEAKRLDLAAVISVKPGLANQLKEVGGADYLGMILSGANIGENLEIARETAERIRERISKDEQKRTFDNFNRIDPVDIVRTWLEPSPAAININVEDLDEVRSKISQE